ncbi:MAG: hypothetical protein ACRYFL_01920 [Janthinobacterium lividum]
MLKKEMLMQTIQNIPDSFSLDDLLDRLVLIQKVETGLQQSEAGQILTTDQAKEKLKKWL